MMVKEYIPVKDLDDFRDAIMDRFLSLCDYNDFCELTLLQIGETIDKIYDQYSTRPAADVRPVVRGEWVDLGRNYYTVVSQCSECGAKYDFRSPYCPSCGAEMRQGYER